MMRSLLVALSLAGAAIGQRITAPSEVRFGAAFELQVEAEGDFDAAALTPLVVDVLERTRSVGGERVRLRARCYELGEVRLGGQPPLTLRVTSALPAPPGELEWPTNGYGLEAPTTSRWLVAGMTAALVVAVYLVSRRRRVADALRPADEGQRWSAAAALRDLDVRREDPVAVLLAVKAILRRHVRERFDVPAEVRTSEELLVALPMAGEALRPCLSDIDLALFSRLPAVAGGPTRSRDRALAFVQATEVKR